MTRPPKPEVAATWEPTASLVPWAQNPRKNDGRPVDELAANMERFGFTAPILARAGTREIIAGHTRWKAAQKIGLDRVAVRFLDVTDAEAHAIALADNRLGELAGWDDDLLREVLAGLEADAVDLDGLGWTAEELEGVMGLKQKRPEPTDDVPEVQAEAFSAVGEVYELGAHRLWCGDNTDPAIRAAAAVGVGAVVTDPPYGMRLDTDYASRPLSAAAQKKHPTQRSYQPVIGDDADYDPTPILDMFRDVDEVFLWGGDYFAKHLPAGGSWLVWDKREGIEGVEYSSSSFELCWSKKMHRRDIIRARWFGLCGMEREDTAKRVHPTQKPVGVIRWLVEHHVAEGGIVWDGFAGSGTTLIACAASGRVARCIELDPKYCDVIRRRWTRYAREAGIDPGPGALEG